MAKPKLTTTSLGNRMRPGARHQYNDRQRCRRRAIRRLGLLAWHLLWLGGWNCVNCLFLASVQATCMGFFGLYGLVAALYTRLTLSTLLNCVGVGFQHGPYTNWQLGHNDRTGAPTLIDRYASFQVASMAIAASVTRKAFTNEAMLERLDRELSRES